MTMSFDEKGLEKAGMVYRTVTEVRGPLLLVEGVRGAKYNEVVEVRLPDGSEIIGTVLDTYSDKAIIQVFGKTEGLGLGVTVRFTGDVMRIPLSDDLLGRVFNGSFKPLDGLPDPIGVERREIFFSVINPAAREPPSEFIQTGISVIDGMNSLVRGQKLPIFSESGLPHNLMAAQIARQSTILGEGEEFAVIFCAMGIRHEEYEFFRREFERTGALDRSIMILNLADDPVIERIIAPRIALTIAEYLAFDLDMHILTILTNMTNYCFSGDTEIITGDGDIVPIRSYVISHMLNGGGGYTSRILSWRNWKISSSPVALAEVIKPRDRRMIYIKTRSGAELTITPDHKLLVDGLRGPEMREARELKPGDHLYSIKKLELRGTWRPSLLELLWMSGDEKIYVHFKDRLIENALKSSFKSLKRAAHVLKLNYARMANSARNRCYTIEDVARISARLGISMQTLSKHVDRITCGKKSSTRFSWSVVGRDLLRLAGMIAADGTVGIYPKKHVYYAAIYSSRDDIIESYKALFHKLFPETKIRIWSAPFGVKHLRVNSKPIALIFKSLSVDSDLSRIIRMPEELIREFLAGYFDGDGHARDNRVVFTTGSKLRAKRIQLLLKRLGIPSTISERRTGFKRSAIYDVIVWGRRYIKELFKGVKLYDRHKDQRIKRIVSEGNGIATEFDLMPRAFRTILRDLRKRYSIKLSDLRCQSIILPIEKHGRNITRETAVRIVKRLRELVGNLPEIKKLESMACGNFILDKVVEVKELECDDGDEYLYDLTIPLSHTIIVENGIISSNCEALRSLSIAREEVPSRKGYPSYMYSDLATIYERAGKIKGKKGSITLMPILTMPGGDITHPIPDLTGYITEGQLIVSRELHLKGIYPPINPLPSLSRLMKDGIGAGKTREDHMEVSSQLYMAYAEGVKARSLARIIGELGLSERERKYLRFADEFERKFINQGIYENRTIERTLEIAWDLLSMLPEEELIRISEEHIRKYHRKYRLQAR